LNELDPARLRRLQRLGTLCGFAAGAWLGAAEAPTKLVTLGVPPVVISFMMVLGVFLARWSLPALIRGTAALKDDVRHAPHLVIWAALAGCLWAVANTLTIFAIKDIGLSIAFPLWNANSLLGILWGTLLFNELRDAGRARWLGVLGGAATMFVGATLLTVASAARASGGDALRGVIAALTAGALWGTMYIPYRKAYLTGMHPLSFVAFFTIGELGMMTAIALSFSGGLGPLWHELARARAVLFWLLLAGFVWVVGDLFQQYAAKYVGISRGIPLSNTNQLWGLVWGIAVFGELGGVGGAGDGGLALRGWVIGGSLLMAAGAGAIALASAPGQEHRRWQEAGARESARYGVDPAYVAAGMAGEDAAPRRRGRSPLDWLLLAGATAVFVGAASVARVPKLAFDHGWAAVLIVVLLGFLVVGGAALWRATRFG
jgi:drug/metabolite transporter (DMT)-like permease